MGSTKSALGAINCSMLTVMRGRCPSPDKSQESYWREPGYSDSDLAMGPSRTWMDRRTRDRRAVLPAALGFALLEPQAAGSASSTPGSPPGGHRSQGARD